MELSLKSITKYGCSPVKRGHKIKEEVLGGEFLVLNCTTVRKSGESTCGDRLSGLHH